MTEEQNRKMMWLNRSRLTERKITALSNVASKDQRLGCDLGANFNNLELAEEIKRLQKQRIEIFNAIAAIHDDELEAIMYERYLVYSPMQTIADMMHYDRKTVTRKHKIALDKIEI